MKYDTETEEEAKLWENVIEMAEEIDKGNGFNIGDLYEDERL